MVSYGNRATHLSDPMTETTETHSVDRRSPKRAFVAGLVLILIVAAGELLTFVHGHVSGYVQKWNVHWTRLRCVDHGRAWDTSDKTATPEGSCH